MIFQDVYLTNDMVANNIRFGKHQASIDEVIEVAKKPHCHELIMKMEKGYDTVIGEGGLILSGGERQCISIDRAIL